MAVSTGKIIIALDVGDEAAALDLANLLGDHADMVKVGLQLFTAVGPEIVERFRRAGAGVFLDLKFHDIPNTVAGAVSGACRTGASMINVHTTGGSAMMSAAREAAESFSRETGLPRPRLLGVTVLTSLNDEMLQEMGVCRTAEDQVVSLAVLAQTCGLDGVVASPREIVPIKEACGEEFLVVTPGIRPRWSVTGDQKRITTPHEAVRRGADFLVIGRPVTGSPDPVAALERIREEIIAG